MWPVDHPLSPTSKHDIAWTLQICLWSHSAHEWSFVDPPIFLAPCKEAAVEAEGIARSQGCHRSRNNDHGIATSLCTYLILTRWKVWTLWQLWPLATPCSSNCHTNVVDGWDFFPPIWSKSWMNATCSYGFGHLCRMIFAQLYCDSAIRAPLTTAPHPLHRGNVDGNRRKPIHGAVYDYNVKINETCRKKKNRMAQALKSWELRKWN